MKRLSTKSNYNSKNDAITKSKHRFLILNKSSLYNKSKVKKKVLVLGNGPSLKDYPFTTYKMDTIGMNMAYRYWNQINWYPTYYCCLDKNVIKNHYTDIYNLIKNRKTNGIKKFFLQYNMLDFYPDLINNHDIYWSNKITPKTLGFSKNSFNNKTTGNWAVRFAVYLGYTRIYILGIDCNYTPFTSDFNLLDKNQVLQETIVNNPNYFFDDYQKKGDWFHIPSNSSKMDRLHHVEGFKDIYLDFKNIPNLKIYNCNQKSKLYTENIIPYKSHEILK